MTALPSFCKSRRWRDGKCRFQLSPNTALQGALRDKAAQRPELGRLEGEPMINDKDIFDKEMSPLFEAYGKACYNGQNLEQSFRFLLALNELKMRKVKIKKKPSKKLR